MPTWGGSGRASAWKDCEAVEKGLKSGQEKLLKVMGGRFSPFPAGKIRENLILVL